MKSPILFFAVGVVALALLHGWSLSRVPESDIVIDGTSPPQLQPAIQVAHGWRATPEGLAVNEQSSPLLLALKRQRFDDLFLNVETADGAEGLIEARVIAGMFDRTSTDSLDKLELDEPPPVPPESHASWQLTFGRSYEKFDATNLVESGSANLTQLWPTGGTGFLRLQSLTDDGRPLVRSLRVRRPLWRWSLLLLPPLFAVAVSGFSSASQLFTGMRFGQIAVYLAVAVLLSAIVMVPRETLQMSQWIVGLAAIPIILRHMRPTGTEKRASYLPLLCVLIFLATFWRVDALNLARFEAIDGDALQFGRIAKQSTWFYDTEYREPLFIGLVKASQTIIGTDAMATRLVSLIVSVGLVPLAFFAGRAIHGSTAGLIAAGLIASNANWASQSVRGMRLETFTAALLLLTAAIFVKRLPDVRKHVLWLAAAMATVCLVRVTSLWFCVAGVAWAFYRRGWNTPGFLVTILLGAAPIVPFFLMCQKTYGDPLHAVNLHIKFYRNQEFRDEPGMPTSAELEANPYAGPNITSVEYFFGMHSLLELGRRTVQQFDLTFVGSWLLTLVCDNNQFLYWWALAAYAMIGISRLRMMLVWMALLLGPIAWLYSGQTGPEWRLIFHLSALNYLLMGIAADSLCRQTLSPSAGGQPSAAGP